MHELIACPVCTLYLRPGMALEEHLETHPKEQVIKALVSLAIGSHRSHSNVYQSQDMDPNSFGPYRNENNDRNAYSQQSSATQCIFLTPPPPPMMIVNRQSTMVYHSPSSSSESREQTPNQRIASQPNFIAPSQLQIFALPNQNNSTPSRLPPPPAYGTAINQLRSQQNQSNIGFQAHHQSSSSSSSPTHRNTPLRQSPCINSSENFFPTCQPSPRPPSSPSVLRYAESPVSAQYVERENGDFIVQESPRHVVECVETESGEFSVIEKVIQSPPSVVQFVDCDKDNDNDCRDYNESEIHCESLDDAPTTPSPRCIDDEIDTIFKAPEGVGVKEVTVLSNVKLDPNESLEIMENLENIKSSAQGELIWSDLADIKRDVESRLENTYKGRKEVAKHVAEQQKTNASTSSVTSVIRLASNKLSNNYNVAKAEKEKSNKNSKQLAMNVRPQTSKRPFKKQPKKLTVKFKVAIPVSDANLTDENKVPPEAAESSTIVFETVTQVNSCNQVVDLESDNASKLKDTKDELDELNAINCTPLSDESERIPQTTFDASDNAIDIENSLITIPKYETDSSTTDVNLDVAHPMVVHEPSLSQPVFQTSDSYEDEENIKERSNTIQLSSSLGINETISLATESSTVEAEFPKLLNQVGSEHANTVDLYTISTSIDNTLASVENRAITTETDSNGANFIFSCSKDLEPSSISIYPSSSSSVSTKATTSTFSLQQDEEKKEECQTEQKAQSEQPTDFNAEYPFGLFYGSTNAAEDQPWTRYMTQQQMSQYQDLDNEQSNYMDLDTYKITSCQVSNIPNIHTDEKMPAKGEISEQESNGDVESSWSNPHYAINGFRITNSYEPYKTDWIENTDGVMPFSQDFVTDLKTDPTEDPMESTVTIKTDQSVNMPNSTLAANPEVKIAKSTSCPRRLKHFQCTHCVERFPLLKERNAHLIATHGYKRVNRRLIREAPSCTITTENISTLTAENQLIQVENNVTITATTITDPSDDVKPDIKPDITVTSSAIDVTVFPRTKYDAIRAGVYRMLMNFNLNVLKSKNVEVDETYFESKSFGCFTCKRNFISVKLYDEHLAEHPAECFTCGRKFTRWTYFSLHLKRHVGWKDFACTVCEKKFVIRSALVEHMRMHTGISPLKCSMCDKTFKRYSNLTQHKKVCHSSRVAKKKDYVCYCGEVLPSKARFLWHKETHETKPKVCPYCRDRFIHRRSLKRHIRLTHSDKFDYIQPVKCKECKQVYAKASMKAHMLTHSIDTQHECSICNKSFTTKWNLKIHSWVHANRASKPYKCEHCIKAFVREVDYKNHLNSHKNIKPFTCEYCGCKFIRKYNYIRHRKEHTAQKRFKCDLCGKLFHRNYYLIEHRRMHTGERPFLCTICGKSSTTKTNHNKHLKIHHSRDPFTAEA